MHIPVHHTALKTNLFYVFRLIECCLYWIIYFFITRDDVTRWQSMSTFEIDISPSIFELERRSKAQNVGNANGYISHISNFRYNFRWKSFSWAKNGGHFLNFEILNIALIWPQMWKDRSKLCQKKFFSWWWRHRWRHRVASNSALYIPF